MLLAIGGMALFLGRSDLTLSYVRAGIRPLLLVSGVVLVALGLVAVLGPLTLLGPGRRLRPLTRFGAVRSLGRATGEPAGGGPGVAWLLVLPLLVLILVAPPALGSYAAGRRQATGVGGGGDGPMPPLERAVGGAVPMELSEFYYRAVFDDRHSLNGVRVRLLGFAAPGHEGGGAYLLARFAMFCCAADAQAVEIAVSGDTAPRAADQWLVIEGHLRASLATGDHDPDPDTATPVLVADSVRPVPPPRDRYEHTLFGY